MDKDTSDEPFGIYFQKAREAKESGKLDIRLWNEAIGWGLKKVGERLDLIPFDPCPDEVYDHNRNLPSFRDLTDWAERFYGFEAAFDLALNEGREDIAADMAEKKGGAVGNRIRRITKPFYEKLEDEGRKEWARYLAIGVQDKEMMTRYGVPLDVKTWKIGAI